MRSPATSRLLLRQAHTYRLNRTEHTPTPEGGVTHRYKRMRRRNPGRNIPSRSSRAVHTRPETTVLTCGGTLSHPHGNQIRDYCQEVSRRRTSSSVEAWRRKPVCRRIRAPRQGQFLTRITAVANRSGDCITAAAAPSHQLCNISPQRPFTDRVRGGSG